MSFINSVVVHYQHSRITGMRRATYAAQNWEMRNAYKSFVGKQTEGYHLKEVEGGGW